METSKYISQFTVLIAVNPYFKEWFKLPASGIIELASWIDTTRTTPTCLNLLKLVYYGWKGNDNITQLSKSHSC